MQERLMQLGWHEVEVVDEDLGPSAAGMVTRSGFERMVAEVSLGRVGAVAAREVSRFARNSREWQQLVEVCRIVDTVLIDQEMVYAPRQSNDRLLLGLKGSLNEYELDLLRQRSLQRIRRARFPLTKTLDQFQWNWPTKINRPQIQNLFRLNFVEQKSNAIFLGGVGLGKTHLCIALGHAACVRGYSVLFTTAIDIIHTLSAAAATGSLKRTMQRYLKPKLLVVDELGYLPIDKLGADLLFQIISERYERGAILSTNRAFKNWPEIFNNDTTLTSALLDRLLHHADTCVVEGKSYRAKDHIPEA